MYRPGLAGAALAALASAAAAQPLIVYDDALASGSTGTGAAGEQFELLDELLVTLVGA